MNGHAYHSVLDGIGNSLANLILVLVDVSTVQVTISGLQSGTNGTVHGAVWSRLPRAKTDHGHGLAVVQRVTGHRFGIYHFERIRVTCDETGHAIKKMKSKDEWNAK